MMLWHMSTSNTINDIHADEYGNACRYYLPSGIPQSVQLGGVHIPADAHAPSHRSDTRSSVIPAWWRAHPRISPLMHTLICMEVTCRSCLCSPADCVEKKAARRTPTGGASARRWSQKGRRKSESCSSPCNASQEALIAKAHQNNETCLI